MSHYHSHAHEKNVSWHRSAQFDWSLSLKSLGAGRSPRATKPPQSDETAVVWSWWFGGPTSYVSYMQSDQTAPMLGIDQTY